MKKMIFSFIGIVLTSLIMTINVQAHENEGYIYIGDSRTVGMESAVENISTDNDFFVCEPAQGYDWFVDFAVSNVNLIIKENNDINKWNIILNLGVNDLDNKQNYFNTYSFLKNVTWKDYNIYFITVNPIDTDKFIKISNNDIDEFNLFFSNDFDYISTKDVVLNDFETYGTIDGIHYYGDTYINIYNKIKEKINNKNCLIY